ncbi:MAG: hypothetical protein HYR95_02745 [Candidatus Colwellbacteria bacterium]|nr:hypothetical protein [Candidatus Colwellbacteria bacterium]
MIIKRSADNPILKPNRDQSWESEAVFNGCPVKKDGQIYLFYRALSLSHYHTSARTKMMVSDIGIAQSKDGIHFKDRRRFIVPENSWERFGCEDPRVTKLNNKYYIFYTALSDYPFRAEGIKVGLAISKNLKNVDSKHLVTPFNAKGMALFPEKIKDKIWAMLTVNTDKPPAKICLASFNSEKDIWSQDYWQKWYKNFEKYSLPLERKPDDQVEVGSPPIRTKYGWLVIYSYIRNYFSSHRFFTVEAILLDFNDPFKVIARTETPILTPEEYYERIGLVPNVVFPSGAIVRGDWLDLYYGAADTTCCLASIGLPSLLGQMLDKDKRNVKLSRIKENPVIVPEKKHAWEAKATFNPGALRIGGKVHLVYRAMSEDNTSVFGYAASRDGISVDYRLPEPIYVPREPFEQKLVPHGNSGCEDPRLTRIGANIYMCYAAYDGKNPPRVALTSISVKDFLEQKWRWAKPTLISPPDYDDKDAFVFPEKFNKKYIIVHRSGDDIDLAFSSSLDFKGDSWLEERRWIGPRKGWWDGKKVGAVAPPVKTKEGWVFLYHGVSHDGVYRVGALLLDLKNPAKIIGRTDNPIFEPEASYEKEGQVSNVVFPCGMVLLGENLIVYYGAADQVTGIATVKIKDLLRVLRLCKC